MKTLGMMHPTDILTNASSDAIATMVSVAGTGQAFDTPTGAGFVSFGANVDFWVRFGSTVATVPTTSSTANTTANTSVLNPTVRNIGSTLACTGISIVSASTGYIVMEWFLR